MNIKESIAYDMAFGVMVIVLETSLPLAQLMNICAQQGSTKELWVRCNGVIGGIRTMYISILKFRSVAMGTAKYIQRPACSDYKTFHASGNY